MKTLRNLALSIAISACGGSGNTDVPVDASQTSDGRTSPTGDAPTPTGATDPANDGPYAQTSASASIPGSDATRTLDSTVFTPTGAPSPRPLVIVSPGFQLARTQYTSYAEHLATWGFVVILTDYASSFFPAHADLAADVPKVIDWALAQSALAVDPTRIALAGHSLGGKISVFAATSDARVKAVVAWDPVDTQSPSVAPELMGGMTAAVAVLGETTNAVSSTQSMWSAPLSVTESAGLGAAA
jgi:dienelactone hydrolase